MYGEMLQFHAYVDMESLIMIANIVFLLCLPKSLNLKVFINEVVSNVKNVF